MRPLTAALATTVLATTLVMAGCGARPVSPADCRPTAPTRSGSLFTLQADPPDSTIRAVLPGPASPTAGRPYSVRWLVDARKAASEIRLQAAREGTGQVYRQAFAGSGTSGQLAEFPTNLVFPAQGCWDTDVFTGTAQGSLTFRVD